MKQTTVGRVVTSILVLGVAAVAARKGYDLIRVPRGAPETHVVKWRELIIGRAPLLGSQPANFTIIEFSDYQCPYCAAVDPVLAGFVAHHPGDSALYRFDMPLRAIHRHAYAAAMAANCAEVQGVRVPYQSLLFQHQKELATTDWVFLAKQGGVTNLDSFAHCIQDQTPRDHIESDLDKGKALGIKGTPTFIINGDLLSGGISNDRLEQMYGEVQRGGQGLFGRVASFFTGGPPAR